MQVRRELPFLQRNLTTLAGARWIADVNAGLSRLPFSLQPGSRRFEGYRSCRGPPLDPDTREDGQVPKGWSGTCSAYSMLSPVESDHRVLSQNATRLAI